MKKNLSINVLGAIALFVAVFFFFSCTPGSSPNDPDDPDNPDNPTEMVKPAIKLCQAENVTANSATLVAWIKPNEKGTRVSFEYKTSTDQNYASSTLPQAFEGKDSLKITFDLSGLKTNSEYLFRVKAANKAGDTISSAVKFSTWIVKDYDGNVYHVIKIGDQYWLQENLKTTHYADGTEIPNVTDSFTWRYLSTGAYCWYDNDQANKEKFGALYNGYAMLESKKFIIGYHIPDIMDFDDLVAFVGGIEKAYKLTDTNYNIWWWKGKTNPEYNSTGFTATPGGCRYIDINEDGVYIGKNVVCSFWTSSFENSAPIIFNLYPESCSYGGVSSRAEGGSIRLIKD